MHAEPPRIENAVNPTDVSQSAPTPDRDPDANLNANLNANFSRRRFLGGAGAAAASLTIPGGLGASVMGSSSAGAATKPLAAQTSAQPATQSGHSAVTLKGDAILVLVTLYGGNDGLDTVIPAADPAYAAARAQLAYRPDQVLPLANDIGLHPSMKRLHAMFGAGSVAIVQGAGYPNPNRSHFRSMDIWQSAVAESAVITGWLGRWHDLTGADPLRVVNVGASVPRVLVGTKGGPASIPNGKIAIPAALVKPFSEMSRSTAELGPLGARIAASGNDLLRVRDTFAPLLSGEGAAGGTNLEGGAAANGEGRSALDYQLDTVAAILKSDTPTRVFSVSLGGFDTHASEREQHARLLTNVDSALGRFFDRIASLPKGPNVVVMVYSEFGRRVNANLSDGTDHGTAAPMFVIGKGVRGGLVGEHPSLTKLDVHGDMVPTIDFRSVYGQVLGSVLGVDAKNVLPEVPVSAGLRPLF